MKCSCPYFNNNGSVKFGLVPTPSVVKLNEKGLKVMVVGMHVSDEEVKKQQMFVGKVGRTIRYLMKKVCEEVEVSEIIYTNVFKCNFSIDDDRRERKQARARCIDLYLSKEISQYKPDAVIVFGNDGRQAFFGRGSVPYFGSAVLDKMEEIGKSIPRTRVLVLPFPVPYYLDYDYGEEIYKAVMQRLKTAIVEFLTSEIPEYEIQEVSFDELFSSGFSYSTEPYIIRNSGKEYHYDGVVSCDFETTELNITISKILSASVCIKSDGKYVSFFFPLYDEQEENYKLFIDFLLSQRKVIFHNYKFDCMAVREILKHVYPQDWEKLYEEFSKKKVEDTLLSFYVLNQYSSSSIGSLDALSFFTPFGNVKYKLSSKLGIHEDGKFLVRQYKSNFNLFKEYNCFDTIITYSLFERIVKEWDSKPKSRTLYEKLLKPAMFMLNEVSERGIRVNINKLKELEIRTNEYLSEILCYFRKKYRIDNLNSSEQKAKIIENIIEKYNIDKDELEYKLEYTRKKGHISTSSENILKLYEITKDEDLKLLYEYQHISKTLNSYIKSYIELADIDGRVHPSFYLTKTETGRLASSSPNFQQIPRLEGDGKILEFRKEFRKALIPSDKNHYVVSIDFSQAELRVAATLSLDEILVQAYKSGIDLHYETAKEIYRKVRGKDLDSESEDVRKTWRQIAKSINFGFIYGMSAETLSDMFNLSEQEARVIHKSIQSRYKTYFKWGDKETEKAIRNGYIETPFGRIRHIDIEDTTRIWRITTNTIIQSVASDLNLYVAIQIFRAGWNKIWGLIHDSIVLEFEKERLDEFRSFLETNFQRWIDEMYGMFGIANDVPYLFEINIGNDFSFEEVK